MNDPMQSALHTWAAGSASAGQLAAFLATKLLFLLGLVFLGLLAWRREQISLSFMVRAVVAVVLASAVGMLLNGLLPDPRPYLIGHYPALALTSTDNGFPSDHTLAAALVTGLSLWLDRRFTPVLLLGTLLIALGRLAIGAHHTLDVLGSLVIAALGLGAAWLLRLPAGWQRALWPSRRPEAA